MIINEDRENKLLFESGRWGDLLDQCTKPKSKYWKEEAASRDGDFDFTHTHSFNEALDLAANGWPEGRSNFADVAASAVKQMEETRPSYGYDVAGMYPSVPRFLGGDPESMVTFDPDMMGRKHVIPVYVSFTFSWSNKASAITNRGAAIAGLVDRLENAGHSVQLVAYGHLKGHGITLWSEYELKSAGEPLDLDMMAFALTHPSTFRRIYFAAMEANGDRFDGDFTKGFQFGYGTPTTGWPEGVKSELNNGPVLMFDSLYGNQSEKFETLEKATQTVLAEWEKTQSELEKMNDI